MLNIIVIECPFKREKNLNQEKIEFNLKRYKNAPYLVKCKLYQTEIIPKFSQDNSEKINRKKDC